MGFRTILASLEHLVKHNQLDKGCTEILFLLSEELQSCIQEIEQVAGYLHTLYAQTEEHNNAVKAMVIKIISMIEANSNESFISKCKFDFLIASSLDRRQVLSQNKLDTEKEACFTTISILLAKEKAITMPIIRALVALCTGPNDTLKSAAAIALCLCCQKQAELSSVSDVATTIMNLALEGVPDATFFLDFSLKNRFPIAFQRELLLQIMQPLVLHRDTFSIVPATHLLRTWPGMLLIGVKYEGFSDIARGLHFRCEKCCQLIRSILNLGSKKGCITDAFTGTVLYSLIENSVFELLGKLAESDDSALNFLSEMNPFLSKYGTERVHRVVCRKRTTKQAKVEATPVIYKINDVLTGHPPRSTIHGYSLPEDDSAWDWETIYTFLTVLLKHSEIEAKCSDAMELYKRIFAYYNGRYLSPSKGRATLPSDCLVAFVDLLVEHSWGGKLLCETEGIEAAFSKVFETISSGEVVSIESAYWTYFKCIIKIMRSPHTSEFRENYNLEDCFFSLNDRHVHIANIKIILQLLLEVLDLPWVQRYYTNMLMSKNNDITREVMNTLRENGASEDVFRILVNCMNESDTQLPTAFWSIFAEIVASRPAYITDTILDIMKKQARMIYPIVFSRGLTTPPDEEIEWWMRTGIYEFVDAYDMAFNAVQTGNERKLADKVPCAVVSGNSVTMPFHLFGQLAQTVDGCRCLLPRIPDVVDLLKSDNPRTVRAAILALGYFGSTQIAVDECKDLTFISKMIEAGMLSQYLTVRGTLLSALSMLYECHPISEKLSNHNFRMFRFGNKHCIVPTNLKALLENLDEDLPHAMVTEDVLESDEVVDLIKEFMNPLLSRKAKQGFDQFVVHNKIDSHRALLIERALAKFRFTANVRSYIYASIKHIPLIPLPQRILDPEQDAKLSAIIDFILHNKRLSRIRFSDIDIDTYDLSQIWRPDIKFRCPEVFLPDDQFLEKTGTHRDEFYNKLTDQERDSLRSSISSA